MRLTSDVSNPLTGSYGSLPLGVALAASYDETNLFIAPLAAEDQLGFDASSTKVTDGPASKSHTVMA